MGSPGLAIGQCVYVTRTPLGWHAYGIGADMVYVPRTILLETTAIRRAMMAVLNYII